MRLLTLYVLLPALLFAGASAGNLCNDPNQRLTEKDAKKILTESPWSRKTTFVGWPTSSGLDQEAGRSAGPRGAVDAPRGFGLEKGSGTHGEKELYYTFTCRLYSALPVRQAHVRIWQVDSKYDKLTPADQSSFDERVSTFLNPDTSQDIIVSIELRSNDRSTLMEVERLLREATTETMKGDQRPYLISDHLGRVELKAYHPPSSDGTGAKLVFPREIDGEPVVLPKDKEVKLEFIVPGSGHKLYIIWRVEELMCNGQLLL